MAFNRSYSRTGMSKGCSKGLGCGCLGLIFLFFFFMMMLSSIELPELNFGTMESADYVINMDSLSNNKMINSVFTWRFVDNNFRKNRYKVSFLLLSSEVQKALRMIDRIGNMSFDELGINPNLDYNNPDIQAKVLWARIYQIVYEKSYPQFGNITDGFQSIFNKEKMSRMNSILFTVSFVQSIKYNRPGGSLDLIAPLGTLAEKFGDCDTKSILLYVLLERMGIDCAMFWSYQYKHAMLGINLSGGGEYKTLNGKKYYFVETTYPGWGIGTLPPDFKNKRYWYLNEIDKKSKYNLNEYQPPRETERQNKRAKPSPAR